MKYKIFYLSIYLFLLLFAPPVFANINFLIPLSVFSLLMIIFKYRKELKQIIINNSFAKILKLLFVYFAIFLVQIIINFRHLDNGAYSFIISIYSLCLVLLLVPICCLYIYLFAQKNKITFQDIIKCIILAGLYQALLTIISLISPNVRSFLLNIMYNNTHDKLLKNSYYLNVRFFGFSNNMLDSFGFGTGLIAALPLFYCIYNSDKWLFTMPLLFLVPFFNSRTGLVIFAIGFCVISFYLLKRKERKKFWKFSMITCLTILFAITMALLFNNKTLEWIFQDFASFYGKSEGTADVLLSDDFWKLPPTEDVVLGKGYVVSGFGNMSDKLGFNSDVGYINEIWKTGIFGLLIMLYICYEIIKYLYIKDKKNFVLFLSIIISLLVANIKFYVLIYNPGITIFILLVFFEIFNNNIDVSGKKVSVIVPIYNAEKYLKRCINSIVKQSYKNLEIILVNDGSTDNSYIICNQFCKQDKRIKCINKENGGVSSARNVGLSHVTGDYICFVDADDYVNDKYILTLVQALERTCSDIAVCNYRKVYEDKKVKFCDQIQIESIYTGKKKFKNIYNHRRLISVVPWGKVYKKEIFNNITYPLNICYEDEAIVCEIFNNADKMVFISNKNYYYMQNEKSITHSYKSNKYDVFVGLKRKMDFFKRKGYKVLYSKAFYDYFYQLIYQRKMIINYNLNTDKLEEINRLIKLYKPLVFKNIYLNPLKKIKLVIKMI